MGIPQDTGLSFDRFAVCEAYYLFLSEYHEGQASDKYAKLCKLLDSFRPRPNLSSFEDLDDEYAIELYSKLVESEEGKGCGVELYVSIYGDGAVLDASLDGEYDCKTDDEGYAIIRVVCSPLMAWRCLDYARGQNMRALYQDGYAAMEIFSCSKQERVFCSIDWDDDDDECFLCGEKH